jgi:glycosyltransferase involved in cell wall biosynthesis
MVVAEALAHGLPVVATAVGGVPEALGAAPVGALPGMLVPPEDPLALAGALRAWLDDPVLRERLGHATARRRSALRRWSDTVDDLGVVLDRVASRPLRRSEASR